MHAGEPHGGDNVAADDDFAVGASMRVRLVDSDPGARKRAAPASLRSRGGSTIGQDDVMLFSDHVE